MRLPKPLAIITTSAALIGFGAFAAPAALAAPSASSASVAPMVAGGNCWSAVEKKVLNNRPDNYRVAAKCSSLNANSKARGRLNVPSDRSLYTSWFTQLNVSKYSDYTASIFGTPTSTTETANV